MGDGGQAVERTAAQILVDQLRVQGTQRVTCVPGESYLAVLSALTGSGIEVITCRNEGGAAYMAEAEGKLTGRPGICFVTRGPGAMNASGGVHVAMQDSTPMILFIGQIDTGVREREAFQEVDYKAVFGSMAKWVAEIDDPARVVEFVTRAFRVAMQGRPGPVVLVLPENILPETAVCRDAARVEPARAAPRAEDMAALGDMVVQARRPLAILGGSGWSADACAEFAKFAEKADLPVATSFRRAMLFPSDHPSYAGDLGIGPAAHLRKMVEEADLILLIGGRLSEMPSSSYSLLSVPLPRQRLVHVHPGAEELGRVYQPDLAIQAGPVEFVRALTALGPGKPRVGRASRGGSCCVGGVFRHAPPSAWPFPAGRGSALAFGSVAGQRDHLQRRRELRRLGAPTPSLPPLRQPACPHLGHHGVWRSSGDCREARSPRPSGDSMGR